MIYKTLANLSVLAQKVRHYHVNLIGSDFRPTHFWLGEIYDSLTKNVDDLAERMRQIGNTCDLTMGKLLKTAEIEEDSTAPIQCDKVINNLSTDYQQVCKQIYECIESYEGGEKDEYEAGEEKEHSKDPITSNLLQEIGHEIDKTKWMLMATSDSKGSKKSAFSALGK